MWFRNYEGRIRRIKDRRHTVNELVGFSIRTNFVGDDALGKWCPRDGRRSGIQAWNTYVFGNAACTSTELHGGTTEHSGFCSRLRRNAAFACEVQRRSDHGRIRPFSVRAAILRWTGFDVVIVESKRQRIARSVIAVPSNIK